MYIASSKHIFQYPKIQKSIQLKHGEAFYDLHTAQETNSVIIFKRKNMEYMSERHSPHLTYDKLTIKI